MIGLCMKFGLIFDRKIEDDDVDCRPGGYEIITNAGDTYGFDFEDVEFEIDGKDKRIVHFTCSNLDLDSYPDMRSATWDDIEDIQDFIEFYADTGWTKEYSPVGVKYLKFENGYDEFVPDNGIIRRISNVIS